MFIILEILEIHDKTINTLLYIACSITVKAEIVVPIFVEGENIGQIDIDSNTSDPFTEKDERFLEFVCKQVAKMIDVKSYIY